MSSIFKFCPNCKSTNHEFVGHHRFKCNDCDFVYFHNVAAAVMVIIQYKNQYLFTVRNNEPALGKLDMAGGFVDPGENAQEAAARELKEELNLEVQATDFTILGSETNDYLYRGTQYVTLDVILKLELSSLPDFTIEESEIQQIKWLKADEVNWDDLAFKSAKNVVRKFIWGD